MQQLKHWKSTIKLCENIDENKPYCGMIFKGFKKFKDINSALFAYVSGIDYKIDYYSIKSDKDLIMLKKKLKELYDFLKPQTKQFHDNYLVALRLASDTNTELPDSDDFYLFDIPNNINYSIGLRKGYQILNIQ